MTRITSVLSRQGFTGSEVIIAVPSGQQLATSVRLPPKESPAPVDQLALAQLAETARVSPDQLIATWWEGTSGKDGERTGLAVGAKRKDLDAFLDSIEAGGLTPVAADVRGCALGRACSALLEPAPALTAIIDLGEVEALLVVMHLGRPVYERALSESGMGALSRALCAELEIEPELSHYVLARIGLGPAPRAGEGVPVWELVEDAQEIIGEHVAALAKEVQVSLSYAAGSGGSDLTPRVLLTGGGAGMPALADKVASMLSAPVRVATLPDLAQIPKGLDPEAMGPSMVTAAGMAMNDPRTAAVEVR
jgi:Tfp pilus assembly PilM family ATPase